MNLMDEQTPDEKMRSLRKASEVAAAVLDDIDNANKKYDPKARDQHIADLDAEVVKAIVSVASIDCDIPHEF